MKGNYTKVQIKWQCVECAQLNDNKQVSCCNCNKQRQGNEIIIENIELDESLLEQFHKDFEEKSTEELMEIWRNKQTENLPEEAYAAIELISHNRNIELQELVFEKKNSEEFKVKSKCSKCGRDIPFFTNRFWKKENGIYTCPESVGYDSEYFEKEFTKYEYKCLHL